MLSVAGLNHFYGGSHTLWDVTLSVAKGSRTCLMGRNGMGKTTLLKCIMGLLPAASGDVHFEGTSLLPLAVEARARMGIGYVPQGRDIFPQLTVEENLRIGLGIRKGGPHETGTGHRPVAVLAADRVQGLGRLVAPGVPRRLEHRQLLAIAEVGRRDPD